MGRKISKIGVTEDKISGRGGLPLFLRYFQSSGSHDLIVSLIKEHISSNNKGLCINQFIKQMVAFFIDGTNCHLTSFDTKKTDLSYCALLENNKKEMASSHQMKRFFTKMSDITDDTYNRVLHNLFIWRLKMDKPSIIYLGIDTMVMDNDLSKKKEGNEYTYKRKKGFQPLHISWGRFLIDVLFRNGKAHSNHGTDFPDRVRAIVTLIREEYSEDVPIILRADSGFADNNAYLDFEEELNIHYIITSRIYVTAKRDINLLLPISFKELKKEGFIWQYSEIGSKLAGWKKFRRAIYTKLHYDKYGQSIMDFDKPNSLIYTNIGNSPKADDKLIKAGYQHLMNASEIISISHSRGADELIHRSIKELATKEQLPFKRFGMNRAYYLLLAFTHFMFESYKHDITYDQVKTTIYPNTFRRILIDFAVKLISQSRYLIMKVTKSVYFQINISILWTRCQSPPKIQMS